MNYTELKEKIVAAIEANRAELTALNDDLADHPEISGQEYETSRKIVELLNAHGFETEYPFEGLATAFKGVYGANDHKYKIAILTEYDALPEIGHACGHCLSGSISILAALATKDLQEELNADIHIIGTPIEETDGAKCAMVEKGVFDGYDMAIMVHLYNASLLTPKLQGLASFMYEFQGKAAHASAAPWEGKNAFNAAQLMFHAVDMLRQHSKLDAQFHGIIRNGGEAPNIVPEKVALEFYIRALDKRYLQDLIQKVDDCAKGAAIATQTTWEKKATAERYDNLLILPFGNALLAETYEEMGLTLNGNPEELFGSSDCGNVSFVCPVFHPTLQVVDKGVPIHTREFADAMKTDRAHKALATGAGIICRHVIKMLADEENLKKLKTEFEEKKA